MTEAEMKLEELSTVMNMPKSDVISFLAGLNIWTSKCYSIEEAIEKHMAQMSRFVDHSIEISKGPGKQWAVEAFYG